MIHDPVVAEIIGASINVIVEVKSIDTLKGIHSAQMLTYLRLTGARHGLLLNFNCPTLKGGMKSFVGRGKSVPI
jgi:GxxExxY protein